MEIVKKILPHICIVLAGIVVIFFVIDRFNQAMTLMSNDMTKGILFALGIVAIVVSGMLIARQRREG